MNLKRKSQKWWAAGGEQKHGSGPCFSRVLIIQGHLRNGGWREGGWTSIAQQKRKPQTDHILSGLRKGGGKTRGEKAGANAGDAQTGVFSQMQFHISKINIRLMHTNIQSKNKNVRVRGKGGG